MKVIIGAAILAAATALPWDDAEWGWYPPPPPPAAADTDVANGAPDSAACGDNESYDWSNDTYPSSWNMDADPTYDSDQQACQSFCSHFTKSNFQAIVDGDSSMGDGDVQVATKAWFCNSCFSGDDVQTVAKFCDSCFGGDDPKIKARFCNSCFSGDDVETTAKFCDSCFSGDDAKVRARFCNSCFSGDDAETTAKFCNSCFSGDDAKVHARFCDSCFSGDDAATTARFCDSCFSGDDAKVKARFCSSCFSGDVSAKVKAAFCDSCFGGDDAETTARFCDSCFGGDDAKVKARFCNSCFSGDDAKTTARFCDSCFSGDDAKVHARFCSSCFSGDDAMTTAAFCSSCFSGDDAKVHARFCSSCFSGDIQNPKPLYGDVKTHTRFCNSCFSGDIKAAALCTGCPGSPVGADYWTKSRRGGSYEVVIAKALAHSAEVACNSKKWLSARSNCKRGGNYVNSETGSEVSPSECPSGRLTCTEAIHNYMKEVFPKEYHLWQQFYCCIDALGQKSEAALALAESVSTKVRGEASGEDNEKVLGALDIHMAGLQAISVDELHTRGKATGASKLSYDIYAIDSTPTYMLSK